MFGHMKADPILTIGTSAIDPAISGLVAITENAQPVRWIEFPTSILLFVSVEGDPGSGAFYVFDRKTRTWFWIDFDDLQSARTEDFDDSLRVMLADAFDQAGAEVLFDPFERIGRRGAERIGLELLAMVEILLPGAGGFEMLPRDGPRCLTDHRDRAALAFDVDTQHHEAVLRIVKGDAVNDSRQLLGHAGYFNESSLLKCRPVVWLSGLRD